MLALGGMDEFQTVVFWTMLVWVSSSDLRWRMIPNAALGMALAVRVGCCALVDASKLPSLLGAGLAMAIPPMVVALISLRRGGQTGLGGGDIKLLFVMGTYLGWLQGTTALVVGCACGVIFCVGHALRKHDDARRLGVETFPLAPFLFLGCVLVVLC